MNPDLDVQKDLEISCAHSPLESDFEIRNNFM